MNFISGLNDLVKTQKTARAGSLRMMPRINETALSLDPSQAHRHDPVVGIKEAYLLVCADSLGIVFVHVEP